MEHSIITDQIDMDFEKAVDLAGQWGFTHIEIHALWGKTVENLSKDEVDRMMNIIKQHNLQVSCLSTTLFLMCPLYHDDPSSLELFSDHFITLDGSYEHHLEKLEWCIEIAKKIDARCLRIFPFRIEKEGVNKPIPQIFSDIAEKLTKPVRIAEKQEMTLVLENCPFSYLPRGVMTQQIINLVNNPSLKLLWDVGNSFRSMEFDWVKEYSVAPLTDEYQAIKSHVFNVHLKDFKHFNNRYELTPFGEGDIPYEEIFRLMEIDHHASYLALEPEIDRAGVVQSVQRFKELVR